MNVENMVTQDRPYPKEIIVGKKMAAWSMIGFFTVFILAVLFGAVCIIVGIVMFFAGILMPSVPWSDSIIGTMLMVSGGINMYCIIR